MDRKLVSQEIVDTTLRPDMVLWSRQANTIIAIELEVHGKFEENCNEAHQKNSLKYTNLMVYCMQGEMMEGNTAACRGRVRRFPITISMKDDPSSCGKQQYDI